MSRNWSIVACQSVLVILLCCGTGCQAFRHWRPVATPPIPVVLEATPTSAQIVAAVNANGADVRQLSSDVRLRIPGAPPLSGNLIVERPRNLRMKVGLIGMSDLGFDVGSNDQEFWFWTKAASSAGPPTLYFARHDDFQASPARGTLPIEPQWILDSIGLVHIDPNEPWVGPLTRPDGHYELRRELSTPGGALTKILVIDRQTAILRQQSLYDERGRLLAYVNPVKHEYDEVHGVSLPRRIELVVIGPDAQPQAMTLDLANLRINELYGDPALQWTRPQPAGTQVIDLASAMNQ